MCGQGRQHKRAILEGLQCREAACCGDDDDVYCITALSHVAISVTVAYA